MFVGIFIVSGQSGTCRFGYLGLGQECQVTLSWLGIRGFAFGFEALGLQGKPPLQITEPETNKFHGSRSGFDCRAADKWAERSFKVAS